MKSQNRLTSYALSAGIFLTLFLMGCNTHTYNTENDSKVTIVEHELSQGLYTHVTEKNIVVLSLEYPESNVGEDDLPEVGKDCFFLKPSRDLDNISLAVDTETMVRSITLENLNRDEYYLHTKGEKALRISLKANNTYEYCVSHDNSKKENQTLFIHFTSEKDKNHDLRANQDDINKLASRKDCTGCDLSGANLQDFDLHDLNLSNARMNNANLIRANLNGTILNNTHLMNVDVEKATLNHTRIASFDNDFSFTSITDTSFIGSKLTSFPTPGTGATKPDYNGINFNQADLSTLKIISTTFKKCSFQGTNFSKANVSESNFDNLNLAASRFTGAITEGASFKGANLSNALWTNGNRCLEGTFGECKQKSDDKLYHFNGYFNINSWIGDYTAGGGIAVGDYDGDGKANLIIFWIDNPSGENEAYYKVSSNIKANGSVDGWSKHYKIPGWIGDHSQGGGIAIGDIDNDGTPNLIIFWIDDPSKDNHGYYKVSSNITSNGSVKHWSEHHEIPTWFGWDSAGGGISIGDTDQDGKPNLAIFWIDNTSGENSGRYRVSTNLHSDGKVDDWSSAHVISGHFGDHNQGGGISIGDYDGDGIPNFVIFYIDNPDKDNYGYYKISTNIQKDGKVSDWLDRLEVPGWFGWDSAGGGIDMYDYDGSGNPNLFIYHINNAPGENTVHYRVGYFNNLLK